MKGHKMKKYILTYGIACVEEDNGHAELVAQISDISTNQEKMEELVKLCNKMQLSPIHLRDIVDDFIG